MADAKPITEVEGDLRALVERFGPMSSCPVSSYAAGRSPFGLDDMSGNVWEWTSTLYDANKTDRVDRGGGWIDDFPARVRASHRYYYAPTGRGSDVGFRCRRAD